MITHADMAVSCKRPMHLRPKPGSLVTGFRAPSLPSEVFLDGQSAGQRPLPPGLSEEAEEVLFLCSLFSVAPFLDLFGGPAVLGSRVLRSPAAVQTCLGKICPAVNGHSARSEEARRRGAWLTYSLTTPHRGGEKQKNGSNRNREHKHNPPADVKGPSCLTYEVHDAR